MSLFAAAIGGENATTGATEARISSALIGFSGGSYRAFLMALGGELEVTGLMTLGGLSSVSSEERDGFRALATLMRTEGSPGFEPIAARFGSPRTS